MAVGYILAEQKIPISCIFAVHRFAKKMGALILEFSEIKYIRHDLSFGS